jgi:acyl-CoA synthetase (NDP forming)
MARAAGKPIVLLVFSPVEGDGLAKLAATGVPIYGSDSEAVRAIALFMRHTQNVRDHASPPLGPSKAFSTAAQVEVLGEARAEHWLASRGIPFPAAATARDDTQLTAAASSIGYPVVLKVSDSRVLHKSDVGGVRVGIRDDFELRLAVDNMREALASHGIRDPEAFLVSRSIEHSGIEWLIGTSNDPQFGPVVAFGVGGVLAEAIRDVAVEPVPLDRARAESLIQRIGAAHVLQAGAFRGRPVDKDALVDLLLKVSEVAVEQGAHMLEMDLNPVVTVPGLGAIALDARVTLSSEPAADGAVQSSMAAAVLRT